MKMSTPCKWMTTALAGVLTVSLAGCGAGNGTDAKTASSASPAAATGGKESPKKENITITFQNIYPDPTTPKYKVMKKNS